MKRETGNRLPCFIAIFIAILLCFLAAQSGFRMTQSGNENGNGATLKKQFAAKSNTKNEKAEKF